MKASGIGFSLFAGRLEPTIITCVGLVFFSVCASFVFSNLARNCL